MVIDHIQAKVEQFLIAYRLLKLNGEDINNLCIFKIRYFLYFTGNAIGEQLGLAKKFCFIH
jgi:hypothetical protein